MIKGWLPGGVALAGMYMQMAGLAQAAGAMLSEGEYAGAAAQLRLLQKMAVETDVCLDQMIADAKGES